MQLICTFCSNGCNLHIERLDSKTVGVDGNACIRGLSCAHLTLHEKLPGKYIQKPYRPNYTEPELATILKSWSLTLSKNHPGIFIQGSPDRSLFRTVIEDLKNNLYILEQIDSDQINHREQIAMNIRQAAAKGLSCLPYIQHHQKHIQNTHFGYWQLSPFIEHQDLDRLTYWHEAWRGKAVARLLMQLKTATQDIPLTGETFSLKNYIIKLTTTIKEQKPTLYEQIEPILTILNEKLWPAYDQIPIAFCHGDPHPLNMLWNNDKIIALIDWEFSGPKPILYDIALIIGCVGVEAPEAKNAGLLKEFEYTLKTNNYLSPELWSYVPLFTLALRFAWLSEWLRRDDQEMLEFEVNYMYSLLN